MFLQASNSQKNSEIRHDGEVVDPQDLWDLNGKSDLSDNEENAESGDKISIEDEICGLKTKLKLAKSEIKSLRAFTQEQANIIEEKENLIQEVTYKF